MPDLTIAVRGIPTPGGSFRAALIAGRAQLLVGGSDQQRTKLGRWRSQVDEAAKAAMMAQRWHALEGPVACEVTFWVPKPKTLPAWRWLPWTKSAGDVDKLVRSTLDALTEAGALLDDSRVVDLTARKRYAINNPPGAGIRLSPVTERL